MASKKASRKSRKKAQANQRAQTVGKKPIAVSAPAEELVVQPAKNDEMVDSTPDTAVGEDVSLATEESLDATEQAPQTSPASTPQLNAVNTEATKAEDDNKQPAASPEPRRQLWALGAALVIMVALVGALVWVVAGPKADESQQANTGQSANVAEIEKLLDGSASPDTLSCVAQTSQGLTPQGASQQLQNVPANTLQTAQAVPNQALQPGGSQTLQPAGCFK